MKLELLINDSLFKCIDTELSHTDALNFKDNVNRRCRELKALSNDMRSVYMNSEAKKQKWEIILTIESKMNTQNKY